MGVLTGNLAIQLGSAPTQDNTHVLAVDLTQSQAQLLSGSASDMLAASTLCYVDGELLSYRDASLTSTYHYSLSPLYRGLYNTWQVMNGTIHLTGSPFVRCDDGIFRFAYDTSKIGSTVWLKFLSFNPYGFAKQSLTDVVKYSHTIAGVAQGITTVSGLSATGVTIPGTGGVSVPGILVSWTPITNSTVVAVVIEFYAFADGPSHSSQITFSDPSTGAGTIAGLQANTLYELRATIVTNPNTLTTTWTTYVSATTPNALVITLGADPAAADPDRTGAR